jgi:hypothetical protein
MSQKNEADSDDLSFAIGFCLDPLGELVHRDEQVGEALSAFLRDPIKSNPQITKGQVMGMVLLGLCRHVCLSCVVLAALASLDYLLGVRHGGWPVETLSEGLLMRYLRAMWCLHVLPCKSMSSSQPSSTDTYFGLIPKALFL